jgi:hypothetical protein
MPVSTTRVLAPCALQRFAVSVVLLTKSSQLWYGTSPRVLFAGIVTLTELSTSECVAGPLSTRQ